MNYTKTKYILYAVLIIYFIGSAIKLITYSQGAGWDAGLCLKMTDNGYKHIPFNHYSHPRTENLDQDGSEFVSWWSPGQFAMPLLVKSCFGITLGYAVKILTMLCLLISSFGIYKLFKIFTKKPGTLAGDEDSATVISLALLVFTVLQPFFWGSLFSYDGGGILMLAYAPWFIYLTIKLKRANIYTLSILLLAALIGFFLKTAFTAIFMGALLYLFLSNSISIQKSLKNQDFKKMVLNAIYFFAAFVIYVLITKIAFLNHSRNIIDSSPGIRLQPRILFYPIVAPVSGLFSLEFLNKTYQWILLAIFIIPLYYLLLRSDRVNLIYKYILISFGGASLFFYSFLYFLNVDVSYQNRHYVIISILLAPAVLICLSGLRNLKTVALILIVLYSAISIYKYTTALFTTSGTQTATLSGLALPFPATLIKKIHALDNTNDRGKDIFFFTSDDAPVVALEIRNNRVMLEDNFVNFHFDNQARFRRIAYFGYNSGEVYVISSLQNFKQDSISNLTRFEKYKQFDKIYQADGYGIFKAVASK